MPIPANLTALYESVVPTQLRSGDPDKASLKIRSISLVDGSQVHPPSTGVTVLVGGNNVGKSTVLRQIHGLLSAPPGQRMQGTRIVSGIELAKSGSDADLVAWLTKHANFVQQGNQVGFVRLQHQQPFDASMLVASWSQYGPNSVGPYMANYFSFFADALSRAGMVGPSQQRNSADEPPQSPLQVLQDDANLMIELSRLSSEFFRVPLTLDRLFAQSLIRIGEIQVDVPRIDRVTSEYREAMATLPALHLQGDGMKSVMGLLLSLVTAYYPLVFVDEPEAFLHPPQAKALGKELGRLATQHNLQVVVATHDKDILLGLLESGSDVAVAHLQRLGKTNTVSQLASDDLRALWADAVLRYSNLLDGLFHRFVVLCEADTDCRFYAAVTDANGDLTTVPSSEVLFVPSGGKAGLAKMAKVLRAVGVHAVASPDLDILNDEVIIHRLVDAVGGEWSAIEPVYKRATAQFRAPRTPATCAQVQTAIDAVLSQYGTDPYTSEIRKDVVAGLRLSESPWAALKKYGESAFQTERNAGQDLLNRLDAIGIICLRVGELENFAANDMTKGTEWLEAALQEGAHMAEPARAHVRRFFS